MFRQRIVCPGARGVCLGWRGTLSRGRGCLPGGRVVYPGGVCLGGLYLGGVWPGRCLARKVSIKGAVSGWDMSARSVHNPPTL